MKSKYSIFFSVMLLGLMTFSCQESLEEISQNDAETFSFQSDIAQVISNTTLKDGSFDNILDNASSFSVKLPISVFANQQEFLINSEADFNSLKNIFNQERYLKDSVDIQFPATIIFADYSEMVVESKSKFDQIISQSIEGGKDEDIECYNFIFPIVLSSYDTENQKASTVTIHGDQKMHQVINNMRKGELVSLNYPIQMQSNLSEEIIVVHNNTQLLSLLNGAVVECNESDEKFYKEGSFDFKTGRLNIQLTDAPFPTNLIASTNVKISQLELSMIGQVAKDSFLILSELESTYNLLDLTNGITTDLLGMQIPIGQYDKIKIKIDHAEVILIDGSTYDLKVPSGQESGIKVLLESPIDIQENIETTLLLDFDVSRSFVVQGNPNSPNGINGFIFKPVIKAVNLAESGTIEGLITDSNSSQMLKGAQLSLFVADTLHTTTFTNKDGAYKFIGIASGTYDIIAELDEYETTTVVDIIVESKENIKVDLTLTIK